MLSLLLSFSLVVQAAAADVPAACRNVAAFDASMKQAGTPTNHLKACIDIAHNIAAETAAMGTPKKRAKPEPKPSAGDSQSAALSSAAAGAGAGADTMAKQSKAAAASKAKFAGYNDQAARQLRDLDQESSKVYATLPEAQRTRFYLAGKQAREDFTGLQKTANEQAAKAGKVSADSKNNADNLGKAAEASKKSAGRLGGAQSADAGAGAAPPDQSAGTGQPSAPEQPAAPTTSPKNALLGIGAVAALGAAAAGGLYLYNQHQKKTDDASAAAAFALAQAQAAQAQATATMTLTSVANGTATASPGGLLMFGVTGSGQIIENASLAAAPIYERAKTDIPGLTTELSSEVSAEFPLLATMDLAKMGAELDGIFAGLEARASAEGNTAVLTGLQGTATQLQNLIQAEIARRGGAAGTAAGTAAATDSATDTSTGTVTRESR